jgi:hypothetical protein
VDYDDRSMGAIMVDNILIQYIDGEDRMNTDTDDVVQELKKSGNTDPMYVKALEHILNLQEAIRIVYMMTVYEGGKKENGISLDLISSIRAAARIAKLPDLH